MDDIAVLQMNDLVRNNLQTDFYANTIPNHLKENHNHIEKPHKHNFYISMLFTKGHGTHDVDFNHYEIKPGTVFMLSPTQTHSWNLSDDIDGYIFFHSQEFLDLHLVTDSIRDYPIFRSTLYPNAVYLNEQECSAMEYLLQSMIAEVKQDKWKQKQLLINLISQFYIYNNRILLEQESFNAFINNLYSNHFLRFETLLEKNYKTEKSAAIYAEQLNMTQKHLNRICQALVEQTTTDVILDRVLLEAKRLLIYTDMNLSEIATTLGYEDYSYFSRIFKRKVGETPKDFLKRHK